MTARMTASWMCRLVSSLRAVLFLGFLRAMEGTGSEDSMGIKPEAGSVGTFEQKMRIKKPPPIDPQLITIPPLVPLPNISRELKKLVDKAYKLNRGRILAEIGIHPP